MLYLAGDKVGSVFEPLLKKENILYRSFINTVLNPNTILSANDIMIFFGTKAQFKLLSSQTQQQTILVSKTQTTKDRFYEILPELKRSKFVVTRNEYVDYGELLALMKDIEGPIELQNDELTIRLLPANLKPLKDGVVELSLNDFILASFVLTHLDNVSSCTLQKK